ncbi:NUDIX domain-containing protein [Blastococcus sp. Marseille-P5729]|uniref:NUDIX hydrolase n=1 Tax=Blastococcus sp. Marseille-P5729 TaxID=2086582 RepID=UPI000D10BFA0|nr:NUDIX domain-containing protein [Blastococcus sp. Marseille-P5729]
MSEPSAPKPAATILLIRDGERGLEVYLIRRVRQMAFAGGMTAYPGGGVDPRDLDADFGWVGPDPGYWAGAFSTDERRARSLVAAAVRETFEESGILLATEADAPVVDTDNDEWEAERQALLDRSHSLAELLQKRELSVRADLIRPWAHWITPEAEPKRYDTSFFLVKLPDGVHPRAISTEHDLAEWVPVRQALADGESGARAMLPPTIVTLRDLAQHDTADEAMAAAPPRRLEPILPELVDVDGVLQVRLPDGTVIKPSVRIGPGRSVAD